MLTDRRRLLAGLAGAIALPAWARGPASYPAPTRELAVPVAGGHVYVRVNGDLRSSQPPLVLVHGGPGGTHAYLLGALALANARAVILYDQLGSGRSDRPADPVRPVSAFVDELDTIRRALGIARWHVLGHSRGGTVALEYAARRPASRTLASLILASPLVSTRSWIADADALRRQLAPAIQADLTSCDVAPGARCDAGTDAFYAAFNGREPPADAERTYADGRGVNRALYERMWGRSEFSATGTLAGYDGEPLLARLDGPRTLFLGGQYDEARPSTLAAFAARVSGAELATVPGAAHNVFGDRPTETLGLIAGWLERHDS